MTSENKFNVYWFGRPWSVTQLKNAALYSDKIVMTPFMYLHDYLKENGLKIPPDLYSICCAAVDEDVKTTINVFKNAGILEIDENVFDPDRWKLVGKMLDAEAENEELHAAITELYMDSEEFKALGKMQQFLYDQATKNKNFAKKCAQILGIDENEFIWDLVYAKISFQHAFYMGLIGSIEKDAYPLTDDEIFTKIIKLKSNKKFLSKLSRDKLPFLSDTDYHRLHTYTASRVIDLTVPNFEKIPPEKIIEIRDNEKQSLANFRKEICIFNREIESQYPILTMERINNKIEDRIIPKLADLESAIENSYYDFLKRLGPDMIKIGIGSLVGYAINMHAFLIALGGSSAPLLKDVWEYLIDKFRYKRNSLYYLVKLKKMSKKYTG